MNVNGGQLQSTVSDVIDFAADLTVYEAIVEAARHYEDGDVNGGDGVTNRDGVDGGGGNPFNCRAELDKERSCFVLDYCNGVAAGDGRGVWMVTVLGRDGQVGTYRGTSMLSVDK